VSLWLVRHGATDWSESGRHTGRTDVPLTTEGEAGARKVASALSGRQFALVLTSPLQRARRTAELSGFPAAEIDDDLREWDYGDYEGITTAEIRDKVPGWTVWTHPCPDGESADQVAARLDRVVERVRSVAGDALVFGHGHALRALTARWLGEPVAAGRLYRLDTATVSQLGYERDQAVIQAWNVPA
jgi:probable phosphoglycerate mutase